MEEEGIPTTQISLIRLHTEKIQPPRALWVPFELGRPLGVPHDALFQKRVLKATLSLLAEEEGPVLADYAEDAPVDEADPVMLACPYIPPEEPGEERASFRQLREEIRAFRQEMDEKTGSNVFFGPGLSGMTAEEIVDWLEGWIHDEAHTGEDSRDALAARVRYAADDLKSFYFRVLSVRPGLNHLRGEDIERWFWKNTAAGKVLQQMRQFCLDSTDENLNQNAASHIIPNRFLKDLEV